jgi:tRNA pseudouridine38-40 synthase
MARYQVILAYDGTEFSGLQSQASARTVQDVFELALHKIGWPGKSVLMAGRTDAGVHALGQVAAFDFDWLHSTADLRNALNANLPNDMSVWQTQRVADDFHPRYDAVARVYRYQILCLPYRHPVRERYCWRIWPSVDMERMQIGANFLVGVHDFASFGTPPKSGGVTTREIFSAAWEVDDDAFTFEVSANAFLYHMVRRMVKLLVDVGQGKVEPQEVYRYLQPTENSGVLEMVPGLAPANGLFLMEVRYQSVGDRN